MMQNMLMNMQQNPNQQQPMMNMLPNNQPQEIKMNKDNASSEQEQARKPDPTDEKSN
jgi:hypothetical protein